MIRSPAGFDGGDRIKRYLDYYQPSYGVMMLSAGQFSPAQLFANGEIGAWYDPSDLTTMFQDSAGTTPVTAVGQAVGLILDKSQGLVLGSELRGNGVVSSFGTPPASATYNTATGVGTAARTNSANQSFVSLPTATGPTYFITIQNTGAVDAFLFTGSAIGGAGASAGTIAAGQTVSFRVVSVSSGFCVASAAAGTVSFVVSTVALLAGNHASQSTHTAKPTYQSSGGLSYLAFDGTDDSLSSAAINFTSTDKMSVFAGVRKLSDAAIGTIAELGTSFAGSFSLFTSYNPAANYAFGTAASGSVYQTGYTASNYSAPVSNVISGSADLSQSTLSNQIKMGINGSAQTLTFTGAGTPSGSFMNGALHVGSRGGSSIRFNGHLYSLIVRGAATDAATITATETWVNTKTLAY